MGEKMQEAKRKRAQMAEKWGGYFNGDKPLTMDVIKQMQKDNQILKEVCDEATKEWIEEMEDG